MRDGQVTEYTYDIAHRMLTIEDPRNIVYLENEYDTAGRVIKQTQADGGEFEFAYTLDGSGKVTQTDVTNPRGFVRRVAFNGDGYYTSDIAALGTAIEQATTYTRLAGSQLVETGTDALGRVTRYALRRPRQRHQRHAAARHGGGGDDGVHLRSDVSAADVDDRPAEPHVDDRVRQSGRLLSTTNALTHQTLFGTNPAGQVISVTDPLAKMTTFAYADGDLVSVQTPLGHGPARFVDAAGRLARVTDALGAATWFQYDAHDQVSKTTDPKGGETTFTYDGNGNLLTLTDARGKITTWTYDSMDRIATRTDPLTRSESFAYDLNGNLITWTDRKGQVTTYLYDALDRQTFIGFGTTGSPPSYASTITTTYDVADRATDVVDSVSGTIAREYDLLDRLTGEVTPEGIVSYTYDDAGRRTSMTVSGQSQVMYTYDAADRLTGVAQSTASVGIGYDNSSRRTSLTLPNGIVVEYGYDDDSRLTSLMYTQGMSTLGDLTYAYDAAGQRTEVGGTYARTGLPAALASATYDDANQIATWESTAFTYDDNGNLVTDGVRTYT